MASKLIPYRDIAAAAAAYLAALDDGWPEFQFGVPVRSALSRAGAVLFPGRTLSNRGRAMQRRLDVAFVLGESVPNWPRLPGDAAAIERDYRALDPEYNVVRMVPAKPAAKRAGAPARSAGGEPGRRRPPPAEPPQAPGDAGNHRGGEPAEGGTTLAARIVAALRRGPARTEELAGRLGSHGVAVLNAIHDATRAGAALVLRGDAWHLDTTPPLGSARDDLPELLTDASGRLLIGAIGDTHLCSKYARLDCLDTWYDEAAGRGIKTVLHAGNWIDGEFPKNRHDLLVHGMDAQMRYLAQHYPRRDGMATLAVWGADHEGWYAQREGADLGRYAENTMRAAGRTDWRDLGYMEAYVRLRHAESGASSMLALMHPGGGSAYAISYAPQKIIEGYDGGDKPGVLLIGHYHKASYQLTRNVHAVQVGCFQDQTPFMRQRKLAAHLGGMFLGLHVDPRTGAVDECTTTFRNFFVRGYYNRRWSQHGEVVQAARGAA